ncbi:MAG: histidine phosphatase family protein [Chloroflexi bacterium]|nr:histidine phosphatase family protein [Chloroflexota bacterium]
MRLYLVRHAGVTVRPERPGAEWHLSQEGRAAADAVADEQHWAELDAIHTSPEPKASSTAQRIAAPHGLPIRIERDLREVEGRGWTEQAEYREQVRRYLAGETVDSWELLADTQRRVRACIESITEQDDSRDVAVVSHGLALTVYLAGLLELDAAAAYEMWAGIRFPDIAIVDPQARRLERAFGA